MNTIYIKGVVGTHPTTSEYDCKFTVADNRKYTNRDGEEVTTTVWHNIVYKGKGIDYIAHSLKKGDFVFLEGRYDSRKFTKKDGTEGIWNFVECFDVYKILRQPREDKVAEIFPPKKQHNEIAEEGDLPF